VPTATLFPPVVLLVNAFTPIPTLNTPLVLVRAARPIAVLPMPVEFAASASAPNAVLLPPDVFARKAAKPNAEFPVPALEVFSA
jgi:hypothetical protein